MKSVSRILLAAAIAVAFVVSASANDRENFSVGHLQVETDIDLTGGIMSNGTLTGMTLTSPTITSPTISGAGTYSGTSVRATSFAGVGIATTTTNTAVLALTGGEYELSNTDAASITNTIAVVAAGTVGNYVSIWNVGTNEIVLTETSPLISGGTLTLGQWDGATFRWQATNRLIQKTAVMNN